MNPKASRNQRDQPLEFAVNFENRRISKPPKPNINNVGSPPTVSFQPNPFQVPLTVHTLQYQQSPFNQHGRNLSRASLPAQTSPRIGISQPLPKPPHSDRSRINEKSYSFSPFAVGCPYNDCGLQMEAADFFHHAIMSHSSGNQAYSCPICALSVSL